MLPVINVVIAPMILLQVWIITAHGSECGLAPSVNLSCADGFAHVEWVASQPGCQFDCKAHWICSNSNGIPYHEESSDFTCNSVWNFDIPWDHYSCNVTVFYKFFSLVTFRNARSPDTTESCSGNSIELRPDDGDIEVGKPYEINCTIYTGKAVNSDSLSISWIGPNGVIANESNRITVIPITTNDSIHTSTSTLQFSYISEEDENVSYSCTASLSGEHKSLSKSFTMSNVTIPPPIVSMTALDNNPIVGKSYPMRCTVTVARGVISSARITWAVNGTIIKEYNTMGIDNSQYVDTYNITELQLSDNNAVYYCKATINGHVYAEDYVTIGNLTLVHPTVSVTALDDKPTVGESFSMECNVTVARGIVGSVDIIWMVNGTVKRRVNNTTGDVGSDYMLHSDVYTIPLLQMNDNDAVYNCEAVINTGTPLNGSDSITMIVAMTATPSPSPDEDSSSSFPTAAVISPIAVVMAIGFIAAL